MNPMLYPPKAIELIKRSSQLKITWSNGGIVCFSTAELRRFCACSTCRARQTVGVHIIDDNTEIKDIRLMGSSGIQIEFADGHDRGVFPWAYLESIASGTANEVLYGNAP